MNCLFLFLCVLTFGFFDLSYIFLFFCFFGGFLVLDFGGAFFGGVFFSDFFSFFFLYLSFLVMVFCFLSSLIEYWVNSLFPFFVFLLSLIFFLLFFSFSCLNSFLFYVSFEFLFMCIFFFLVGWGQSQERFQASVYIVFYTVVVSFPFLVYVVFFETSLLSMNFLFFFSFSSYWWGFLFFVFLVKLPVYGLHLWLPKAHVEAPVSGSMVLAGVLLKLGAYGLHRFSFFVLGPLLSSSGYFFSFGIVGGTVSCFLCLRQHDINAFVAYSSVCHMGAGLAGFYCFSFFGWEGGFYMFISHGFCSSCLFYILYLVYERFHSRSLFVTKGLGYVMPTISLIWFVFSAMNMGVPPSFSFFSEIFILIGSSISTLSCVFFFFLFFFLSGTAAVFFYSISCHGLGSLSGGGYPLSVREYLSSYGHFFPLVFFPFFLNFFC